MAVVTHGESSEVASTVALPSAVATAQKESGQEMLVGGDAASLLRPWNNAADSRTLAMPAASIALTPIALATSADATPPVTIPFPTAAHLFIPGAMLAIFAARRMRPRYSRR